MAQSFRVGSLLTETAAGLDSEAAAAPRAEVRPHPFGRLLLHFMDKIVGLHGNSDLDLGLGALFALLALPGAFMSLLLLSKYSSLLQWLRGDPRFDPYRVCLPDEYFFLVYSMTVTGLLVVARWNELLPDARDWTNLAHLPIRSRTFFLASASSLALLGAAFILDINAVSAVLFPLMVTANAGSVGAPLEFMWAHASATVGIAAFTFCTCLALKGVSMALLPFHLSRRVSFLLRLLLLLLFAGNLISILFRPISALAVRGAVAHWWPPIWFLSLFERQVGRLHRYVASDWNLSWLGLMVALTIAVIAYGAAYRRHYLHMGERRPAGKREHSRAHRLFSWPVGALARLFAGGLERGTFLFTVRTLPRSEGHLIAWGLLSGIGLLLAVQSFNGIEDGRSPAILAPPLLLLIFMLSGLHLVLQLPADLGCNWLFRLLAADGGQAARVACRKLYVALAAAALLFGFLPVAVERYGLSALALLCWHGLFVAIFVAALLRSLNKIPFACAGTPGRETLVKSLGLLVLLVAVIVPSFVSFELNALRKPSTAVLLTGVLALGLRLATRRDPEQAWEVPFDSDKSNGFAWMRLSND